MKTLSKRRPCRLSEGNPYALILKENAFKLLFAIFINFSVIGASAQKLMVTPLMPHPGDTLNIVYDPAGGKLPEDSTVTCKVYLYQNLMPVVKNVELKRVDNTYNGIVATPGDVQLAAFTFYAGKDTDENPDGYIYNFYNQGKPIEGTMYLKGNMYVADGIEIYHFKKNDEKALPFFRRESENYPDGKYTVSIVRSYYQSLYDLDKVNGEKEALKYIDSLNSKKEKAEQDYTCIYYLYLILNKYDKMQETLDALSLVYPNSLMFFTKRLREIQNMAPASLMEQEAQKLIADYKMDSDGSAAVLLPGLNRNIGVAFLKELNYPKFYTYLYKWNDPLARAYTLITGAKILSDKEAGLNEAAKMAAQSINLLDSIVQAKPGTANDVKKMNERYGDYLNTYGYVLYQLGNYADALAKLKRSFELTKGADPDVNMHYALTLIKDSQYKEALPLLEDVVKNGNNKPIIEQAYKEAYLKTGGSVDSFNNIWTKLAEQGTLKSNTDLLKKMINEPAPLFTLKDLDGKTISLADLKGKIVVLDFWATWCGPCKEAFPGMQKLVDKYSKDKDIVFLFVNTLENMKVEEALKDIRQYIKDNAYTFHIVMDERIKDSVRFNAAQLYNAGTIPLKIVIDKTGNIRFRSSGFPGSTELVVDEISSMIEMAR